MANQTSARIKGDDYQFLYCWFHVLSLKKKNSGVVKVRIEDRDAMHVDDVTVYYKTGTPPDFYQVKYHVDHRDEYSIDLLLDSSKGSSLLEKFYKTYRKHLDENPGLAAKLHLVTNWNIATTDEILSKVSNEDMRLPEEIYLSTGSAKQVAQFKRMSESLKINSDELFAFLKTMCFLVGKDCTEDFKRQVAERMELVGLKHDENALAVASQIVRDWVKAKRQDIDLPLLEKVLEEKKLFEPPSGPKAATVYLTTVKKHTFDLPPDYSIDLRKFYAEQGAVKGHELLPAFGYEKDLFPKIIATQKKVNAETGATLIRARGFSRLSPWFAFGHVFSGVSSYTIEVNQNENIWRTNQEASAGFKLVSDNSGGESFGSNTKTVAVGLSVTGNLAADVRNYITTNRAADALLLLKPEGNMGPDALKNGGDVVALAQQFKQQVRDFVKAHTAEKLLIFYYGPMSGACFIGHQLNAICNEIQIMENLGQSYVPAFILK